MNLKDYIEIVEDFPKKGISFKDITTLIKDGDALKFAVDLIVSNLKDKKIDMIAGPEARGFIFGVPVAYSLGIGFVPVRKKGKLPGDTIEICYDLEYGQDVLQIQKNSIKSGMRIAVVDDLLATGGTIKAVADLIKKSGGEVIEFDFVIELMSLKGRDLLKGHKVNTLVKYES